MKHFFLLLLLSVCFLIACKKDKDETEPVISIFSPYYNQNFNVLDTVKIHARVSDETKLTSVQVVLQDMNGVNAQVSSPVQVQGNEFQFTMDYILYETHLESGNYKLCVIASDGTNTETSGIVIYVNAMPLAVKYYYMASEGAASSAITRYDSLLADPQVLNYNARLAGMASSSWYQRLYLAPEQNGNLEAYNCYNHQMTWSVQDLGGGYPYFSVISKGDDKNVFVGYNDGRMMMYNYSGTVYANYQTGSSSYYPAFIYVSGSYVFAAFNDFQSSAKQFRRFDKLNAVQQSVTPTNWQPAGMGDKSSNEFYVAGNDNTGQGVLNIYYTANGGFYSPVNLPAGSVISAIGIDSDYFLIAHSNGTLYRYQYSTASLVPIFSGLVVNNKMQYNSTLNELYLASGNIFYIFNVNPYSLTLKNTFLHSGTIDEFEVVFNK